MSYRSWTFFGGVSTCWASCSTNVAIECQSTVWQAAGRRFGPLKRLLATRRHRLCLRMIRQANVEHFGAHLAGGVACADKHSWLLQLQKASRGVPVHLKSTLGGAIPVDIEFAASCNDKGKTCHIVPAWCEREKNEREKKSTPHTSPTTPPVRTTGRQHMRTHLARTDFPPISSERCLQWGYVASACLMLGVCLRFKAAEFTHASDRNSPVPVAGAARAQDRG